MGVMLKRLDGEWVEAVCPSPVFNYCSDRCAQLMRVPDGGSDCECDLYVCSTAVACAGSTRANEFELSFMKRSDIEDRML